MVNDVCIFYLLYLMLMWGKKERKNSFILCVKKVNL